MSNQKRNISVTLLGMAGFALAVWLLVVPGRTVSAATDGSITGTVTDDAGKPLRAATVTAKIGGMSVSRFSDASGKYHLDGLTPGKYNLTATAYGYEIKSVDKDIASGANDATFSLKEHWSVANISTSEMMSAVPASNQADVHKIEGTCTVCHNFSWINRKRGQTAAEWQEFIPQMSPRQLFVTPRLTPEEIQDISVSLEKVFGPNAPLPTKEQVKHIDVSDEALNATFKLYTPPTHIITHSLVVAPNGLVWFTEQDNFSNRIASFDPRTSEFQEFEMPTPKAGPHNPWVGHDGKIWISENASHKLAMLDPAVGKVVEYNTPDGGGTHTLREDSKGNIWTSGAKFTKFDPKTARFTLYDTPSSYDIAVDHEDNIWGDACMDARAKGMLARLDAKTGELKIYPVPNATFLRGIEVDAQDNIWFGDVMNHRLGHLDTKTEKMTFYAPPTPGYSIYGVVVDKTTGKIWTGDYLGSNVTRFDPATGKFTEFPFPSRIQMIRFFGEDAKGQIWFTDFTNGRIGVLNTGESKGAMAAQR